MSQLVSIGERVARAGRVRRAACAVLGLLALWAADAAEVRAAPQEMGPFANLDGWWGGTGRLRFKDGKTEDVKCRATYFVADQGNELKQTIRCASAGGKIELKSLVKHADGKLSGDWTEVVYNISGTLEGAVTPRGFRVTVKASETQLSANMDIIAKDTKQMVEIQFFSETLIGLTLLLSKG